MYSLSLQEKKLTTNRISFQNLFKNKITTGENNVELNFYIDEICKGGRPRLINNSVSECIELNRDYVKNIISSINRKNITKPTLEKVLKDLSRNICCGLNISSIAKNTGLSKETVSTYLDFLVESNIIEYIYC
jgi:predicted AAA+ superfamily ATPase